MRFIEAQARLGDIEGARTKAAKLEVARDQKMMYRTIAQVQAEAGDADSAIKTVRDAEEDPVQRVEAICDMVDALRVPR